MSTELVSTRPSVVSGGVPQALIPIDMDGLSRLSKVIFVSGMAPKEMRNVESVAVAILAGMEIGLTPMQSVQSMAVVNGRPTVWGDAALALVIGHPSCEDITETVTGEGENMVAVCTAKRKGRVAVKRTFSVSDAKKASLWNKAGPWQQYPARMLQLRARAFALRDAFPDVLRGIGIKEEQDDVAPMKDVTPRKADDLPPFPSANVVAPGERETMPMNGPAPEADDIDGPEIEAHADDAAPSSGDPWAEDEPQDEPEDFAAQAKSIRESIEAATDMPALTATLDMWADRVSAMPDNLRRELRGVAVAMTNKLKGGAQ